MSEYFKGTWQNRIRNEVNTSRFLSLTDTLYIYDLGSTGGTPPPFCWILDGIQIINFEPDPRGYSEPSARTLPVAIGPHYLDKIYLNRRPTTSSLLKPNRTVVERYDFSRLFGGKGDIFDTIDVQSVETYGLDEVIEKEQIPPPDFLKVDVQGLGFEVLESSKRSLAQSVIGLQIEVEFIEAYQDQKTWWKIDELLQNAGFEIFRISNLNRWYYRSDLRLKRLTGQDVFCDLLYMKSINTVDKIGFWNSTSAVKAIVLQLLFDLTDTAAAFFEEFDRSGIIRADNFRELQRLIREWPGSEEYFYPDPEMKMTNRKKILDKLLDVSPRKLLRLAGLLR